MIQPPPVTKSPPLQPGGGGPAWQVMSACADEMTTSATPSTMMWSALTVMSPERALVCSLMITRPFSNATVWFGAPEMAIVWPFTDNLAMSELPLAVAPASVHFAVARASRKPAEMLLPPTVSASSATDASDWLLLPCATEVACSTSAVSSPGTLAFSSDASAAPPDGGRGPASTSVVERPSTVARTTVARPL